MLYILGNSNKGKICSDQKQFPPKYFLPWLVGSADGNMGEGQLSRYWEALLVLKHFPSQATHSPGDLSPVTLTSCVMICSFVLWSWQDSTPRCCYPLSLSLCAADIERMAFILKFTSFSYFCKPWISRPLPTGRI